MTHNFLAIFLCPSRTISFIWKGPIEIDGMLFILTDVTAHCNHGPCRYFLTFLCLIQLPPHHCHLQLCNPLAHNPNKTYSNILFLLLKLFYDDKICNLFHNPNHIPFYFHGNHWSITSRPIELISELIPTVQRMATDGTQTKLTCNAIIVSSNKSNLDQVFLLFFIFCSFGLYLIVVWSAMLHWTSQFYNSKLDATIAT